jgi:LytS/YehU family sensor histidine kinase
VLKLSDIMRYMLYDSNTDRVLVSKEVEYLQGFIELQKLRLDDPDFVEFSITGDITSRMIAPMMLIPFVENAFKHGRKKQEEEPGITIHLNCNYDKIVFEVTNAVSENSGLNKDAEGGIGLQNIRRRLELLYPGRHQLEIFEVLGMYSVRLVLE